MFRLPPRSTLTNTPFPYPTIYRAQARAAEVGVEGQGVPATGDELRVGVLKALGRAHYAVLEDGALAVAGMVQRRQHVGGELAGLFQDGAHQVGCRILVARQPGDLRQAGDGIAGEEHIGDRDRKSTRLDYSHQCATPMSSSVQKKNIKAN